MQNGRMDCRVAPLVRRPGYENGEIGGSGLGPAYAAAACGCTSAL